MKTITFFSGFILALLLSAIGIITWTPTHYNPCKDEKIVDEATLRVCRPDLFKK